MKNKPRIAIVGLQHQGKVQAACFADVGYDVVGIDEDKYKINRLINGQSELSEPGLDRLIQKGVQSGRLQFSEEYDDGIQGADFVFLSIDVSFNEKGLDLLSVFDIAREISIYRDPDSILCVTTQVPVGTSERLTDGLVAYIPEFLRPGQSVKNFMEADRIVIGSNNATVRKRVANLYAPFQRPILEMSLRSAEMSKHAHNAILATQISFINEISNLCEKVDADVDDVAKATKADNRVGANSYLNPGWSLKNGHLIRDVRVLQKMGVENNCSTALLDAVALVDKGVK
jgi:UDPglucose 6-dehydrogenase